MKPTTSKGFHAKLGHCFGSNQNVTPDLRVTLKSGLYTKSGHHEIKGLSEIAVCFLHDDVSGTIPRSPYSCICTRSALVDVLVSGVSSQDGESVAGRWDLSHSTS